MNDSIFLDTNVLIYCYTSSESDKQIRAQVVADLPNTIISTQILNEFANTLRKKFKLDWSAILSALNEVETNFEVYTITPSYIKSACFIADRYGFSYYDSLIVAAALEAGCSTLYSEDMQHDQVIETKLTGKNPFITVELLNDNAS